MYEMFMDQLKKAREQTQKEKVPVKKDTEPEVPLITRIENWMLNLSEEERQHGYTMAYFQERFQTSKGKIGAVLITLKFGRFRRYPRDGMHQRFYSLPDVGSPTVRSYQRKQSQ